MDKVAAVTGGSSGIGLELCRLLTEKGYIVYCLSRSKGEAPCEHIPVDVTDERSISSAFRAINEKSGRLDLLINNAGCGISGAIEFTELKDAKRQLDVNFYGMFLCSKHATALLRASHGRIINVSSIAAIFSIPFQAFYSVSKAAINSLTLSMRNELKCFGISVCAVMPGDVKTGFTSNRSKSNAGDEIYGGKISPSVEVMEKDEQGGMSPASVAGYIVKLAGKKHVRSLYTAGAKYKFFYALSRVLPISAANTIVGGMYIKDPR